MHDPICISFKDYRAKIKWMYVCMYVYVTCDVIDEDIL